MGPYINDNSSSDVFSSSVHRPPVIIPRIQRQFPLCLILFVRLKSNTRVRVYVYDLVGMIKLQEISRKVALSIQSFIFTGCDYCDIRRRTFRVENVTVTISLPSDLFRTFRLRHTIITSGAGICSHRQIVFVYLQTDRYLHQYLRSVRFFFVFVSL